MRIYDPRIGKFLSVDPIASNYPMLTPYQFASNSPIQAIDLDGLEGSWAGALQGVPAGEIDNFHKGLREGHKKGLIVATTAAAVTADLYFTGGKVSQFFLGAQFLSGFNHNKAKTVEGRIQQEKDSRNAISQAVFAYGTGVALGKIFTVVAPLFKAPVKFTSYEGGATYAELQGEYLGNYSYSRTKGLELDLNIPKELQGKGLGSKIFETAVKTTKADKFTAKWIMDSGYEGGMSTNLKDFYGAIKGGAKDAEAAFSTWSGQQAKAAGFKNVVVQRIGNGVEATFTK
jgi:hypothetical protein